MKTLPPFIRIFYCLTICSGLFSCQSYNYVPSSQIIHHFDGERQMKAGAAVHAAMGFDAYVGLSGTNHLGIGAKYTARNSQYWKDYISSDGFEPAVFYFDYNGPWRWEVQVGAGFNRFENFLGDPDVSKSKRKVLKGSYRGVFVQPSYSYCTEFVNLSISTKVRQVNFYDVGGNINYSHVLYTTAELFELTPSHWFIEPALTAEFSVKNITVFSQAAFVQRLNTKQYFYKPPDRLAFFTGISLQF